jgi:plastocyanin domain-containing protein
MEFSGGTTLSAAPSQPVVQQSPAKQPDVKPSPAIQDNRNQTQSVTITLNEKGYEPESFQLRQGVPARVTFVRKIEGTCGTEVVLEAYKIKRELPLNQPVVIEFTPTKTGEFKFACGMDMLRGKIIVR